MISTRLVFCKATSLSAVLILSVLSPPLPAQHHAVVEWYAELAPAKNLALGANAPPVQTHATGKVTIGVDFPRKTVTIHVDIKELSGIRKIELRADRSRGDLAGEPIVTVYDVGAGRFSGSLTKTVTGAAFDAVAGPILNSRAGIVVTTDKNPNGEITGKIIMHKHYQK